MKKKFSAVTALTLTLAMVLTACSGGGGGETTAAAGGDTKAAGETTQAAAPSGDAVKMTMGTGGTTGIMEPTCSRKRARQQNLPQSLVFTQRSARWFPLEILNRSRI